MQHNRIFIPTWMTTIIELPTETVLTLAKNLNVTQAHLYNLLDDLEAQKYIIQSKKGRCTVITLTSKGQKMKEAITELFRIYGRDL